MSTNDPARPPSSRRAFLAGGAAVAISTGAAKAASPAPTVSAEVAAAIAEHDEACRAVERASDVLDEAVDRWFAMGGDPPIPDALIRDPKRDWIAGFYGFMGSQLPDGRWWYGAPDDLAYLREPRLKQDWGQAVKVEDGVLCAYVPDPVGQARADEILAAHAAWVAEHEARRVASGRAAAETADTRAVAEMRLAGIRLANTPASSHADVRAKLAALFTILAGDAEEYFSSFMGAAQSTDDRLSASIVRDLLVLTKGGAA